MKRLLLLNYFLFSTLLLTAKTIVVKNSDELTAANKKAMTGDIIILQDGEWKNLTIHLTCNGTKENPITFRSQTRGKVLITGNSKLKLGGNFLIIDGLNFINGYAGNDAVVILLKDANGLEETPVLHVILEFLVNHLQVGFRLVENGAVENALHYGQACQPQLKVLSLNLRELARTASRPPSATAA